MVRVGLVVPEYRTPQAPGGGVATVADFILQAVDGVEDFAVEVVSPRMWHGASESQRLLSPSSWFRGPIARRSEIGNHSVTYVGSRWAEVEVLRYRGSALLRRLLAEYDVLVVVSGTPASFELVRGVKKPVLAQVATTFAAERRRLLSTGNILRRARHRVNTALASILDRSGVRIPATVLVENPWMADWCCQRGAKDVRIELPGIDTHAYSPGSEAGTEPGYILSVGRLAEPRKDLALLVRAYAEARQDLGVRQNLVLAGREFPPEDVVDTIRALGLEEHVTIRSDVGIEALIKLYQCADFFAMSSSEEGLGMVMMEAMGCGLAVVSTATEGAKVIVDDSVTGTLVPFGDNIDHRLASALAHFSHDEEARRAAGGAARRHAEANFSSESTGARFVDALRDLVGGQ